MDEVYVFMTPMQVLVGRYKSKSGNFYQVYKPANIVVNPRAQGEFMLVPYGEPFCDAKPLWEFHESAFQTVSVPKQNIIDAWTQFSSGIQLARNMPNQMAIQR